MDSATASVLMGVRRSPGGTVDQDGESVVDGLLETVARGDGRAGGSRCDTIS